MQRLRFLFAAAFGLLLPISNAWSQNFDGTWNITLHCPTEPGGAEAYTYRFSAKVQGGNLQGQYGTPGKPSSVRLSGKIEQDGSAKLIASGLTGSPQHALGHVETGTSYTYPVSARFDGRRGTGKRDTKRACSFEFLKG